jgi:hypothetical protein
MRYHRHGHLEKVYENRVKDCYSESKNRIRVSREKSDEAVLLQQIQLLALKHGKALPADRIREWISRLWD